MPGLQALSATSSWVNAFEGDMELLLAENGLGEEFLAAHTRRVQLSTSDGGQPSEFILRQPRSKSSV